MKKLILLGGMLAGLVLQAVVVKPENTKKALVNPDMGFVMFHYSNRLWAYGQLLERGDTLDWFPGTSTVYFRVPWCVLEPQEGKFRWDILDSYAQPWIAAGKQISFRVTCSESRYPYATPKWVRDAGAKGWEYKMVMPKIYGKYPPGADTLLWEPDYGDPVFLEKLEKFLRAMAKRYDGKPYVAYMDVGTIGMWGEGHTRAYKKELLAQGRDPEAAFRKHLELHRKCFPNTTLIVSDDVAGNRNPHPNPPLMNLAKELKIGLRDDSILVDVPTERNKSWYHENWAQTFAPTLPVFVEHEHFDLSQDRGAWNPDWLEKSVEDYRATWLSIHGWPDRVWEANKEALQRIACRIGYRFELREVQYPEVVKIDEKVKISSTWVNVGVARKYKGATLTWSLLDEKNRVAWSISDESFNFADLQPKIDGKEVPVKLTTECAFGHVAEIPQINDGLLVFTQTNKIGGYHERKMIPTLPPGKYKLCVSVGTEDGTPQVALPLENAIGRRYPVGMIEVR